MERPSSCVRRADRRPTCSPRLPVFQKPLQSSNEYPSAALIDVKDDSTTKQPGQLHFVVPAPYADPNSCTPLVSAGILGYPAPITINWAQSFHDNSLVEGGSHLAQIIGVYESLGSLPAQDDEDFMLMVNGHDV